ncbi:uncharacterized protein B0T23DRAFT_385846 [Neurospora hispaniola]|uniref:Secreted protein n=1 Tax=Neurospora hispaniola TaxID=588809 RepID=A0AAJ0I1J1_9PEZI|nr:hypothetical protein B0T23DRAFT_385846 [Neurospora hispaniola]
MPRCHASVGGLILLVHCCAADRRYSPHKEPVCIAPVHVLPYAVTTPFSQKQTVRRWRKRPRNGQPGTPNSTAARPFRPFPAVHLNCT